MRKFSIALRYASSILVALVALVFVILEATLLVTLDFLLYENQIVALVQLILRFLIASCALTLAVLSLIKRERSFLPYSICLFASSVVMIFFVSNNFGVYFTIISAIFLISQLRFLRARD